MKELRKYIFSFAILLPSFCSIAQQNKIDSLLTLLKTDKQDTTRLIHLYNLCAESESIGNYFEGLNYGNKALVLSDNIINRSETKSIEQTAKKFKVKLLNTIGIIYFNQGNYSEAKKNYLEALKINIETGNKIETAFSYNNLGVIYRNQGNYPEALKNHFSALKIRTEIGDNEKIAASKANIGLVYYNQGNYSEALKIFYASLNVEEKILENAKMIGDFDRIKSAQQFIAKCYTNIGNVYERKKDFQEALKYHYESLKLEEKYGKKRGIALSYGDIGIVYQNQANALRIAKGNKDSIVIQMSEALKNHSIALKIFEEIGDKNGIAFSNINIGSIKLTSSNESDRKSAKLNLEKALLISKEIGSKEWTRDSYKVLVELDSTEGDFKEAYNNHKMYILFRDSLDNEETRKKTIQSQMTYDFEKKEAIADAEHKKELENQEAISDEKNRKQKLVIAFVVGGLLLVLVFAGFIFRSLSVTRKQKLLIEQQKLLVEEHQKEIIDSITYARRIQHSLLPTTKYIERTLNRLKNH